MVEEAIQILNSFESLNLEAFPITPHLLLAKNHEWFPKFDGNNVSSKNHVHEFIWEVNFWISNQDDEDIIMMLFALSFEGEVRDCCVNLPLRSTKYFDQFEDVFMKRRTNQNNISNFYGNKEIQAHFHLNETNSNENKEE